MRYADSSLCPGETVVCRGEYHWVVYVPGLILLPFLIGLPLLLFAHAKRKTTEMAVTNRRVILKRGVLSCVTFEMPLSKVENVSIHQGLIGRVLNYGTVAIGGSGGTKAWISGIVSPAAFRHAVLSNLPATMNASATELARVVS